MIINIIIFIKTFKLYKICSSHVKPTKTLDFPILRIFVLSKEYAIIYST